VAFNILGTRRSRWEHVRRRTKNVLTISSKYAKERKAFGKQIAILE